MKYIFGIALSISLLSATTANLMGMAISQYKPSKNPSHTSSKPISLSSGQSFSQKGLPTVELNDPAGDVEKGGADIIKMIFHSDGQNVNVSIELKDEVASTFSKLTSTKILELFFDTDMRVATGGKLVFAQKKGFERRASIVVCIVYSTHEGQGTAKFCSGGLTGGKIKEFLSGTDVERYDKDGGYSTTEEASSLNLPNGTVQGNRVEAAIPYNTLGVRSGQTIRIMAAEGFERSHDSRYSRDILLMLK